jgi:uncharacterized protein
MSKTTIDVTKESPLDYVDVAPTPLVQILPANKKSEWVPSKYNVRTTGDDGSYVVWNTRTGAINIFKPEQRRIIQELLRHGHSGEPRGIVKYLSERGMLVTKGADEYRQVQLDFGQMHYRRDALDLILLSSEDCNFRCEYCYEDFPRGTMLPWVRDGIKKMVERRAARLRYLTVGWFGGEPLYGFKAMEDLAPFFVDLAREHSIGYSSHITTNAYLLTQDVAEKLLAWNVRNYQITLDGVAEQHNKKRPTRDGRPTFETIFTNLRALKKIEEHYVVRLRVNYDRENYPHLDPLLALFQQEFGGDPRFGVAFHGVGKWGGSNDPALAVYGVKEAKFVKRQMQQSAVAKGLTVKGGLREMNMPGAGVCYAARPNKFVINAEGKIMKCTVVLDKAEHNVVGTLAADGQVRLNNENYSRWVEPAFEADPVCRKCILLPTCQGISCPLTRVQHNQRPCASTIRSTLRAELLTALESSKAGAREVTVSGGD